MCNGRPRGGGLVFGDQGLLLGARVGWLVILLSKIARREGGLGTRHTDDEKGRAAISGYLWRGGRLRRESYWRRLQWLGGCVEVSKGIMGFGDVR